MSTPAGSLEARPRPYRRYLTSAFHSRFVHASILALLVAFDNTFWISSKRDIWSWFPVGPAIFKTLLLFLTSLLIFILHVATLDIGRTTTKSPLATLRLRLLSLSSVQTVFWYIISAWWFSEVYIWTSPASERLGWVSRGDVKSSDRLNERPIYLRAVFLALALIQSARHTYYNYSSLAIPVCSSPNPSEKDQRTHPGNAMSALLRQELPTVVISSVVISAVAALLGPFYYTLFLRQTFWSVHLQFAKLFFNLSRANARPMGYPPSNPFFMLKSFFAGFLLVLTWQTTTFLFQAYLIQEPLKKDQPLSAGSKDPNGTLLNGLKAKKTIVKTFAFWELAIIAQRFPERRKAIFGDIDRVGGPRWAPMLASALEVVQVMTERINLKEAPAAARAPETANANIEQLPRIVPEISRKQVMMNAPKPRTGVEQAEEILGAGMKRLGQSAEPWSPPIQNVTRLIENGKASPHFRSVRDQVPQQYAAMKASPIGWLFKSTPERKINVLVLGSSLGNAAVIVDAVESVTKMLVASLAEDTYGKAVAGVPESVRTFTKAIIAIESLLQQERLVEEEISEVKAILARLKSGLNELLAAFQLYLADVGLGIAELNAAKKAAGTVEKEEVRRSIEPPFEKDEAAMGPVKRNIFEAYKEASGKRDKGKERVDRPSRTGRSAGPGFIKMSGMNGRPNRAREMEMAR